MKKLRGTSVLNSLCATGLLAALSTYAADFQPLSSLPFPGQAPSRDKSVPGPKARHAVAQQFRAPANQVAKPVGSRVSPPLEQAIVPSAKLYKVPAPASPSSVVIEFAQSVEGTDGTPKGIAAKEKKKQEQIEQGNDEPVTGL